MPTIYRGSDGTISVAAEPGAEGDKANEINDQYSLTPIGRVTGVTVKVTNDVQPFHELGQRFASELRPGNVNVSGTIGRAYINGALLKLMLGDGADNRPAGTFVEIVPNLVEGGRAAVLKPGSLRESSKPFTTKENRREETISHSGFREATASQPQRPHPPAQPKLPTHAALG